MKLLLIENPFTLTSIPQKLNCSFRSVKKSRPRIIIKIRNSIIKLLHLISLPPGFQEVFSHQQNSTIRRNPSNKLIIFSS